MTHCPRCGKKNVDPIFPHTCTPPRALALAEQPAEQQEPVYSIEHLDKAYELGFSEGVKAAPQPAKPAERVPLTDEELDSLFPAISSYTKANRVLYTSIARVIELAHGIGEKT